MVACVVLLSDYPSSALAARTNTTISPLKLRAIKYVFLTIWLIKFHLRIDNGDFHVNGLVFTFLLIYLKLYDISYTIIHHMKAEIIGFQITPMTLYFMRE